MSYAGAAVNQHASKALTKQQRNFQLTENFARNNESDVCQCCGTVGAVTNDNPCTECGFPAQAQPRPEPGIVRGVGVIRRIGESYAGNMTMHGSHYILAAEVAEDKDGKFFRIAAFDNMDRQLCEIPLAHLPVVARDPRNNATQREMLDEIHKQFAPPTD